MSFLFYATLVSLIFVAVVLILLILIQKGRGGGLSSAFGGSGGTNAFGAKTGDVLTWATSIIFGIFVVLAVALDLVVSSQYPSVAPVKVASSSNATSTMLPPLPQAPEAAPVPAPATTQTVSEALSNLTQSLKPATSVTTAPSMLENGLSKMGSDITKAGQKLKPTTKP